jgi:mannitol/fructose-specific phosphotransferase system IIA component (Ntr-type)
MIRVLKARTDVYEIVVVPALKPADVASIQQRFAFLFTERGQLSGIDTREKKFTPPLVGTLAWTLVACLEIPPPDTRQILEGVFKRELIGTTAYGRGIAIPHTHTQSSFVSLVTYCVLRFEDIAFDFEAADGKPARIFVLGIIPPGKLYNHLRGHERLIDSLRKINEEIDGDTLAAVIGECFGVNDRFSVLDL